MAQPYVHIKSRRDTANNWYIQDPVLQDGEIGIETDTNRMKVGDNVTPWNDIKYSYNAQYDPYLIHFTHDPDTAFTELPTSNRILVTAKWARAESVPILDALTGRPTYSLSAYLFRKTDTGRNRLVLKPFPIPTDTDTVQLDFFDSEPFVDGAEYQIEVVDNTNLLVGAYTLTYNPRNLIEFYISYRANNQITASIRSDIRLPANTYIQLYSRPSAGGPVTAFGGQMTISSSIAPSDTTYTNIICTLTGGLTFTSGRSYFGQYTYNTTKNYAVISTESTYYIQGITGGLLFDPDQNKNLTINIVDQSPTTSVPFTSIFVDRRSEESNSFIRIGTRTVTAGTRLSSGPLTISLSESPKNNDTIRLTANYANGVPIIITTIFRQRIDLKSVIISSINTFAVNANNILGEDYNVQIKITRKGNESTGPVVLYDALKIDVADLENSQQPNLEIVSGARATGPEYSSRMPTITAPAPKPCYGICVTPFSMNVSLYTVANMRPILIEAVKFSYRIRIYSGQIITNKQEVPGYPGTPNRGGPNHSALLLDTILQTIEEETDYRELKNIQILAAMGIEVRAIPDPSYPYWETSLRTNSVEFLRARDILHVLEKYGTQNIIGISLGNETLELAYISRYSDLARTSMLNKYYLVFQYLREYFTHYNTARTAPAASGTRVDVRDSAGRIVRYVRNTPDAIAATAARVAASTAQTAVNTAAVLKSATSANKNSRITAARTAATTAETAATAATTAGNVSGVSDAVKTAIATVVGHITTTVTQVRNAANAALASSISGIEAAVTPALNLATAASTLATAATTGVDDASGSAITGYAWGVSGPQRPIYAVPLGIIETPRVVTETYPTSSNAFTESTLRTFLELCDFVGVNIHPLYSNKDADPVGIDDAFNELTTIFDTVKTVIRRYNSNAFVFIAEVGIPGSDRYTAYNATLNPRRLDNGASVRGFETTTILTTENQRSWVNKLASQLGPTGSIPGTIYHDIPFYYFGLVDNYAQAGYPKLIGSATGVNAYGSKGNYVVNWGLYTYATGCEDNLADFRVGPSGALRNVFSYTSSNGAYPNNPFRQTAIQQKSSYFDGSALAISSTIRLDTSRDINYGGDYPDIYKNILGRNVFLNDYQYEFEFLAGGNDTNVYIITAGPTAPILTNYNVLIAEPFTGTFDFDELASDFISDDSIKLVYTYTSITIPDAVWTITRVSPLQGLVLEDSIHDIVPSRSTAANSELGQSSTITPTILTLNLSAPSTFINDNLYDITVSVPGSSIFQDRTIRLRYLPIRINSFSRSTRNEVSLTVNLYDPLYTSVAITLYNNSVSPAAPVGNERIYTRAAISGGNSEIVQGVATYQANVNFADYYNSLFFARVQFIYDNGSRTLQIDSSNKRVTLTGIDITNVYFRSLRTSANITLSRDTSIAEIATYYPGDPPYAMPIRCKVINAKNNTLVGFIRDSLGGQNRLTLDDSINGVLATAAGGALTLDFMDAETAELSTTGVYKIELYAIQSPNNIEILLLSSAQYEFRNFLLYTRFADDPITFVSKIILQPRIFCSNRTYARSITYKVQESSSEAGSYTDISRDNTVSQSAINTNGINVGGSAQVSSGQEFKIGYFYRLTGSLTIATGDTQTLEVSTPKQYSYTTVALSISTENPSTTIVDGFLRPRISWKGPQASGRIVIYQSDVKKYESPADIVFPDNPNIADLPPIDDINGSTFLTPGTEYTAWIIFTGGANTSSNSFVFRYNPTTIASSIITYNASLVNVTLVWRNPPRTTTGNSVICKILSFDKSTTIKTQSDTIGDSSIQFTTTGLSSGTSYYLRIELPGLVPSYDDLFEYTVPTVDIITSAFEDDLPSTITEYTLGQLRVTYKFTAISNEVTRVNFYLYEYSAERGGARTIIVTNIPSYTPPRVNINRTITQSTKFLKIGKWYQILYGPVTDGIESDLYPLMPNRLQYKPKGFDIIILAGADNMVGRDRYFYTMPDAERLSGTYRVQRDTDYPQLQDYEKTTTLIDKNNNSVKIYNFLANTGGSISNNPDDNENINLLHRFVGPTSSFTYDVNDLTPPSNVLAQGYTRQPPQQEINCGHEFIKYYASQQSLTASNRQICVIPAAIPLSRFKDTSVNTPESFWNAPNGRFYTNIQNSIQSIVNRDTLTTIPIDNTKLRFANQSKTLKYGCLIETDTFKYSKQIVDNFDYCYLISEISLSQIHPRNIGNIAGDNFSDSITDERRRTPTSYLPRELQRLRNRNAALGTPAIFPPFNYTYNYREADYNFDSIKPVAEFLRDNGMKLRINGLISFDDTTLLGSGFWLNTAAMGTKDNAIWAIMRHCYVVVNWFNTNYPGLVVAYDIIRNYYNTVNLQTHVDDQRDDDGNNTTTTSSNLKFVDRVGIYSSSNPNFEFAQAAFIGAYAACKDEYDAGEVDLCWSDERLDVFRRKEGTATDVDLAELDNIAVLLSTSLATIHNAYQGFGVLFPINSISFQSHYLSGNFVVGPSTRAINDVDQYQTYITGTRPIITGSTNRTKSLLHPTQGVLKSRIDLFQNLGSGTTKLDLKVELTEFGVSRSAAVSGNQDFDPIKNPNNVVYWTANEGGAILNFRTFQFDYFIEPIHEIIRTTSIININKSRIGFGGLSSVVAGSVEGGGRQRSFFFETVGSDIIETANLNYLKSYKNTTWTYIDTAYTNYTAHRIVAFLWEGGGRMYGNFTDTNNLPRYLNTIADRFNVTPIPGNTRGVDMCRPTDTIYLIGNDEYGFVCRQIATQSTTPAAISDYTSIVNIDNIANNNLFNGFKIASVSTLGLHSIDPNTPWTMSHTNTTPLETVGYLVHGCFSSRSQRVLGLRFFNAFLNVYTGLNNDTTIEEDDVVTNFPIYAIERDSIVLPTRYEYDTLEGSLTNISSKACSFNYANLPIGYFITAVYKNNTEETPPPTNTNKYAILTEYSTTDKSTSSVPDNSKAFIPYFTNSSNVSMPPSSRITSITISGISYSISNVVDMSYTRNSLTDSIVSYANGSYTLKNVYSLEAQIRDFLENRVGASSISGYDGVQLFIRAITCDNSTDNSRLVFSTATTLPPVALVRFYRLFNYGNLTSTFYDDRYLDIDPENTNFRMTPLNNSISHCFLDVNVRGGIFVGCSPEYTLIPGTTLGYRAQTVSSVIYSILGSNLKDPHDGLGADDVWAFNSGTNGTYTASNNGRLYSIIQKDLDWISFVSRARYNTRRTSRTTSPITYASYKYANQFAGICWTRVNSSLDPVNSPSARFPFFFISNAETFIVIKLHNVHFNKSYNISYLFSVQNGRVPYDYTFINDETTVIGGVTYNFRISNAFPVRVYSRNPITLPTISPVATHNLFFEHNTVGPDPLASTVIGNTTNSYLHTSSSNLWDGSWKECGFNFRISPATGALDASTAYLQLGPLPFDSMVETSFNFANIKVTIQN